MTTKKEFLKIVSDNFSENQKIMNMVEIIDENITYTINLHKENKAMLEELQNFPQKNLQEYQNFCDKFLRKEFGDIVGVDSIFIYTHPKEYKQNLAADFAIEIDDGVAELIEEVGKNLLQINITPFIKKHSWVEKIR